MFCFVVCVMFVYTLLYWDAVLSNITVRWLWFTDCDTDLVARLNCVNQCSWSAGWRSRPHISTVINEP